MRLLADITDFLPLVIGAIAFIGWMANKLKEAAGGNAAAAAPGAAAGGNEGGRVQVEIDRFLQEVRGTVGKPPAANVAEADDAFEAPAQPARQQPRQARSTPAARPDPPEKPKRLVDRHVIGQRHVDSHVVEQVAEHLPSQRMENLVEQDLGHGVEQSVASHLGSSDGTQVETAEVWDDGLSALSAESLIGLLTRPEGIRQAVLVHEILSRPKGRRGRRGL